MTVPDESHEMAPAPAEAPCWRTIGVWGRDQPRCPVLERVVHCRNCEVYTDAGRNMLHRPPPDDYGAEWVARAAEPPPAGNAPRESALVFRVGGELLALPVAVVLEVLDWRPIRSIPHRRDGVLLGVVNVGGDLHVCVSLEMLFGSPRPDPATRPPKGRLLAIGEDAAVQWIVPVEETLALPEVPTDALEDVPVTLFKSDAAFVRGLFVHDGQRVGLLDAELLLATFRRRVT
jgi:chemotaxis-related protein WspD